MKTFVAPNGREVVEIETSQGVTVSIDTSIPVETLKAMSKRMSRKLALLKHFHVGEKPAPDAIEKSEI